MKTTTNEETIDGLRAELAAARAVHATCPRVPDVGYALALEVVALEQRLRGLLGLRWPQAV